jgi:capsular polysaccharide biosynthesis protein
LPEVYGEPPEELIQEDQIDFQKLFRVLRKWAWMIALATGLAVVTAAVLSFFVLQPVYEAQVTLMVTQAVPTTQPAGQPVQGQGLEQVMGLLARLPQMTLKTYVGQLTSESLMKRVLSATGLDKQGYTAKDLARMVQAKNVRDTSLIEVTVRHTDPEVAANVANAVSREFTVFVSEQNREQMAKSVEFLTGQLAQVEKDLAVAREELRKLQSEPRGVAVVKQEFDSKSSDLARLQSEVPQLQVSIDELQASVAELRSSLAAVPRLVTVEEDGRKVEKLNDAYVQLSQALEQRLSELAGKRARLDSVKKRISELEKELAALQAELVEKESKESTVKGKVDQLNQTYLTLSQKITEVQIARSISVGEATILVVSPAYVPSRPVSPKKGLNMALSGVAALAVSAMLSFVLERLDNTVKTGEDVQRILGAPVLGSIPVFAAGEKGERA